METLAQRLNKIKDRYLDDATNCLNLSEDVAKEAELVLLFHGTWNAARASQNVFDWLFNAPEESAEDFCKAHNLDPKKPATLQHDPHP